MIERQTELRRRYHRKKKMAKLKAKLKDASGEARTMVLYKIKCLSPNWTEASLTQGQTQAPSANKAEPREPKRKAPAGPAGGARPRAEKK
jgi:hypothetical protein